MGNDIWYFKNGLISSPQNINRELWYEPEKQEVITPEFHKII